MSEQQKLFAIKDVKADIFDPPWPEHTYGVAERQFESALKEHPKYSKWPGDFELYHVGLWDEKLGEFENVPHNLLSRGKDLVAFKEKSHE